MSIKINFSQGDCRFVFFYNKEKHESFQKQFVIYTYKKISRLNNLIQKMHFQRN